MSSILIMVLGSVHFEKFKKSYGFQHVTSSPHYVQSNGFAERGVQTVKNLLKKAEDPYKAMLVYRDTIIESIGLSPAQIFLGRKLKTTLPTTSPLLKPIHDDKKVKAKKLRQQVKQKQYCDRHSGKELSDLEAGNTVLIQTDDKPKKWEPGKVLKKHENRSYTIENSSGNIIRRNRKHLRQTKAALCKDTCEDDFEFPSVTAKVQPDPKPSQPPNTESIIQTTRSGRSVKMPSKYNDLVT